MGYTKQALQGISWVGGLRFLSRSFILLKTAILARLLTPAQFGIFGIITITVTLFEILTETGINAILIQEDKEVDSYINTAWIVSILRGFLISLLIVLFAYPLARFFSSTEAAKYLLLASLVPLIKGFINPSLVKFRKDLEFKKQFNLRLVILLVESITAVILVFYTRSVIGLVISLVIGATLEAILSFIFCFPRPRLVWQSNVAQKIITRGKWVTLAGIFTYFVDQGDDAVVGRILGLQNLGLYQMAYKISNLPFTEITDVFSEVTFPVYAKISTDLARIKRAFKRTLLVTALFVAPGAAIIFFFPELVIRIILGSQWLPAAQALKILALFGLTRAISGSVVPLFLAFKRQDLIAKINFAKLILLMSLIFPLIKNWGVAGAALAILGSSLLIQPLIWINVSRVFKRSNQKND